jgi:beta-lactamase superfamily II metal-dependent hydrolase
MRPLVPLVLFLAGSAYAAKTLDIYFIDVEGGQSTLIVSPSGQTLLIDAGWTGLGGRDADRIATAAKLAKVKRIDYLLVTHHHPDHGGGVPNVIQRLPVGTFLDHGPSVELAGKYAEPYATAFATGEHKAVRPGDTIPVKGLDVTVMVSAGEHIDRKGEPNPFCAGIDPKADQNGEDPQSAGVLIQFGKFRFVDFGDLTWNKELALLCPENRVGKIDLYLTTHHGAESPKAIFAMAPRVAIMNNGARKGGAPEGWKVVKSSPGIEDLWQLHFAVAGGKEANSPDTFIANVDEQCEGKYLKVSAESSGAFSVYNSRNKYSKSYAAR